MSDDKTTPRPWCAIETPHWTLGIASLQAMKVVASIPGGSDTGPADRALIVRAVNAHEELTKAMARLIVAIETDIKAEVGVLSATGPLDYQEKSEAREDSAATVIICLNEARAALAKASAE